MPEKQQERKIKIHGTLAEAADWLRDLADGLENPSDIPVEDGRTAPADFTKLKIGLKRAGARVKIRAKFKGGTALQETASPEQTEAVEPGDENDGDGAKADYKRLKKAMKKSFKTLKDHLEADDLPPADAVSAFLTESEQMIRFPGFGDEFYEAYREACFRFREAHRTADLAACKNACDELERLKSDCHDRYK